MQRQRPSGWRNTERVWCAISYARKQRARENTISTYGTKTFKTTVWISTRRPRAHPKHQARASRGLLLTGLRHGTGLAAGHTYCCGGLHVVLASRCTCENCKAFDVSLLTRLRGEGCGLFVVSCNFERFAVEKFAR